MRFLFNLAVLLHLFHLGSSCVVDDPSTYESVYQSLAKRTVRGPPKKTTINNVRFFNGVGFTTPTTVVLNNGMITYVGPAKQTNSEVQVNGTGKFLIPGLIDSHCHISSPSSLDTMASYGVTTAVNMACYNYHLCESLMNLTGTASMITAAVGAGSAHAQLASLSGAPANETLAPGDNSTEWVGQFAYPRGSPAAFLKAVAEPGGPDQELLNDLVVAARQMGHYTVMHAAYISAYEQAVIAQPKGIQHRE